MDKKQLAAAQATQAIASAQARAIEADTLPYPPSGYPALQSIAGPSKMESATVMGYEVVTEDVRDLFGPDGKKRYPGDDGFRAAQMARLYSEPMPKGWRFETRRATVLYALVDGNPILLKSAAREGAYPRACASSPKYLRLGEIVTEEGGL